MEPERLNGMVHVGRQPARVYRDALRARGISLADPADKLDEWASLQALERLLARAERVEARAAPELWSVVDEHGLRVSARVIRWGAHTSVIGLTVRDVEDVTLDGATWTAATLERYARARGKDLDEAAAELRVALHLASPVDVARHPEKWRARSRMDGFDVTLAVNVVDRDGARLVVAAEGRRRR